jgi:hypothetical protein
MTHHPHVHMIVPGGGLSPDGSKWIACRPDYFVPVEVPSARPAQGPAASGITASSPTAPAQTTSLKSERCCLLRLAPKVLRSQLPIRPAHCRVPVPAAVVVCSSSSFSSPAASPSTSRARPRRSSRSTHHDAQRIRPTQHRPCVLPDLGQYIGVCPNAGNQHPSCMRDRRANRACRPAIASIDHLVINHRWHWPPLARSLRPSTGGKSP